MLGRLALDEIDAAAQLCTLVFRCDLPLLRRYLSAGIPVDAGGPSHWLLMREFHLLSAL